MGLPIIYGIGRYRFDKIFKALVRKKPVSPAIGILADYVKKHLIIKVDSKPVNLEFVGYEVEGASLWSYYQVKNISSVQKIEVSNNLLYEMFDSPISIVHARVGGNKKSNGVNNPETYISLEF